MKKKELIGVLAWPGLMLVLALGATVAHKLGTIDRDTVIRVVIGANGLMVAWYGNKVPKAVVKTIDAARAKRVAGWAQVLSGLVYTMLWAFAPINTAIIAGSAALVAGLAVTLGYCLLLRSKTKTISS